MIINFGEVPLNTVLYVPFDSYSSAGASVTISGLAVTDIEIYKDGSVTQRASDAGYVLLDTDGTDFDGLVGIHGFSIDLADNTTAGFYTLGGQYRIAVSSVTIDGQTVSFTAGIFRIGLPNWVLAGTASAGAAATFTMSGGVATDDYYVGLVAWIYEGTGVGQARSIIDFAQSTGVFTVSPNWATNPSATSKIAIVPPTSSALVAATDYATASGQGVSDANVDAAEASLLAQIAVTNAAVGTPVNLGGGATLSLNLVDIEGQTDDIGVAGAGLTAVVVPTANQIRDAVWAAAMVELAAIPGATGTVLQALTLLFQAVRNKTVTSTPGGTTTIGNNAGTAIGTAPIADAAGVFTKDKFV